MAREPCGCGYTQLMYIRITEDTRIYCVTSEIEPAQLKKKDQLSPRSKKHDPALWKEQAS